MTNSRCGARAAAELFLQAPAQQVKGAQASVAPASNKAGELPFTGFPAWALALIGAAMLAAGLGLRRVAPNVTS